ncbi:uncharacterized protein FA14DRAFT_121960 [Meira miltonrushii]|uniref:Alpha/beta-hydrolase n=1 Tax=Meira miltonrushii TaxID=1280837 RepID=A0A316VJ11_9BASI|nr:uncharacterized protein FA14DRAFT_121960 [Meira miltonrushii]PWN36011.1 hypothetical protein FA14DRAFT_121960 [Meira miltonrushii]
MDSGHKLRSRDASTLMSRGKNNEGEDHKPIVAPSGSIFTSLPIGSTGQEVPAFWTVNPNNSSAKHAYIMIHGKLRNGGDYWTTMNNILQESAKANVPGASDSAIVVAPQFFSKKYNSGEYTSKMLAFADVNGWQAGDPAIYPPGTKLTSFDALDALVDEFMNQSKYPNLQNITVVGHGGGGQLNQRYAMVAKNPKSTTPHIRYIHGDPSSCAYFTKNRPMKMSDGDKLPSRKSCKYYNTWRYGFDNFTGTADGLKTPKQYFQQYITRDVISIVGYQDVLANGDNYCMAQMQGGSKRRDRNLSWWQYVNTLARTNEDLKGFPATYGKLPDWSDISHNQIKLRLSVVENASHSAEEVFSSQEGRSALFSNDVLPGWRPQGWVPASSSSSKLQTSAPTYSNSQARSVSTPSGGQQTTAEHDTLQSSAIRMTSSGMTICGIVLFLSLAFLALSL